jgi:hypothetical protein
MPRCARATSGAWQCPPSQPTKTRRPARATPTFLAEGGSVSRRQTDVGRMCMCLYVCISIYHSGLAGEHVIVIHRFIGSGSNCCSLGMALQSHTPTHRLLNSASIACLRRQPQARFFFWRFTAALPMLALAAYVPAQASLNAHMRTCLLRSCGRALSRPRSTHPPGIFSVLMCVCAVDASCGGAMNGNMIYE